MIGARVKASLSALVIAAATAGFAAGCAGVSPMTIATPASTAAVATPQVRECGIVSTSSPVKYACGGKVYTSFQLAKLREADEKKNGIASY